MSHQQFIASTRSLSCFTRAARSCCLEDTGRRPRCDTVRSVRPDGHHGGPRPPGSSFRHQFQRDRRDRTRRSGMGKSLTDVVLASSVDLRTATADQANSATQALIVTYALTFLLLVLALGAVLMLSRQVRRPLDHIVAAATSVQEGELDIPALDESGPKELAFGRLPPSMRWLPPSELCRPRRLRFPAETSTTPS